MRRGLSSRINIILIGPTGAGKSTIGKSIAELAQLKFYDVDREIEQACGADIPWIFDIEGEAGFRRREAKVIDELTQEQGIVLATGGGAILSSANRNTMAARGIVVYLQASIEQQVQRTLRDKKRPLLQTDELIATLQAMRDEREPLYEEIADHHFETDCCSVGNVAKKILEKITDGE